MLCLSLFPTFTPSNFVRVIDSSVPCALAFWLCFVTPHLYQLARLQSGGLSFFLKKTTSFLGCFVTRLPSGVSPQPRPPSQAMGWCLPHPARCSVQFSHATPRRQWGAESRTNIPGREDGDGVRVSNPSSFCSGRASPSLALISGTSRKPLSLRQRQGSGMECRVGGAAVYK